MKHLLLVFFIFILSLKSVAQDYSIVNFMGRGDRNSCAIYINDRPVGSISGFEHLELKMYSEGRISIIIINGAYRSTGSMDVKHGDINYYLCPFLNVTGLVLDEKKAEKWIAKKTNTIQVEEDRANPFIKTPTSKNDGPKQGTCFLIHKKGYFLTNYHVIRGATTVQVNGIGNDFSTLYGADVIAYDVNLDMALLKLKNQNVVFEDIPYSINLTSIQQGSKAFVMGYPMSDAMGEEIKLTDGIISARSGYKGSISHYQFSAPVQPGNSGSPLFNENGDLIAIINSKITEAEGVGYAIKGRYIDAFLKLIDGFPIEPTTNSISNLSLTDKAMKLKNFIFIVKSE